MAIFKAELVLALRDRRRDGAYPWGRRLIVAAMEVVFTIIGFLVGVIFGTATLQLARGGRNAAYRDLVARHPWIRLMSGLWIIAWGILVAVLARGFTH